MTRDRLRPLALVRTVLVPPLLVGAAAACLLVALAAGSAQRARAGNALAPLSDARPEPAWRFVSHVRVTPPPVAVGPAPRPPRERARLLARHPYVALYRRTERRFGVPWLLVAAVHYHETGFAGDARTVMAIAAGLREARARDLGRSALRAVTARYRTRPDGRTWAAMVVERARAWRRLGAPPPPGRGELATPTRGVVGGCGVFHCPRPGHLHNGIDLLAPTGTPVHAADLGRVAVLESVSQSGGYGNFVCLQHRPQLATCYAHLSAIAAGLRVGARVRRGEVIGLVGSTGSSSAPHLHFEVRRGPATCPSCAVDPLALLSGDVPRAAVPRMLQAGGGSGEPWPAARPRAAAQADPPGAGGAPASDPAPAPAPPPRTRPPAVTTGPTPPPPRGERRPAPSPAPAAPPPAQPPAPAPATPPGPAPGAAVAPPPSPPAPPAPPDPAAPQPDAR